MQLPNFLKNRSLIFLVVLLFISAYVGFIFGKIYRAPVTQVIETKQTLVSPSPTISPTSTPPKIWSTRDVPINTKQISYRKGNSIFIRNLNNNQLTSEKNIVTSTYNIENYVVSQNLKYVAYTYFSLDSNKNSGYEMPGNGDELTLKEITTGKSKVIISGLKKDIPIAFFSFNSSSNKLFFSLMNDDIFVYSIENDLLTKVYSNPEANKLVADKRAACRGYQFIDESPNSKYLIVNHRCTEGGEIFLFNTELKTFTKIGGGYTDGIDVEGFINDNEIYGRNYKFEGPTKYLKLNLFGGIIQELPAPTDRHNPKAFFGLYTNGNNGTVFLADKTKHEATINGEIDSNLILGTDVTDIKFHLWR